MPGPVGWAGSGSEVVCPYLRLETTVGLEPPAPVADGWHRCVALGDPIPPSRRQQELVCLQDAHTGCPRYLRATSAEPDRPGATPPWATVSRPILVSLVLLVLAGGISFGFVLQRGSFGIPAPGTPTPDTAATSPTPAVTPATTVAPTATPPPATAAPTVRPTPAPTAEPTVPPTATPPPVASPSPRPTVGADRYAWLEPCPDAPDCWIYVVRPSVSLLVVAEYFGHPISTLLEWNPWITDPSRIRVGDRIRMPPPTR